MIGRRETLRVVLLVLAALCAVASPPRAQTRTYRLVLLAPVDYALEMMREALSELQKLGYVEGRNLVVQQRNLRGDRSLQQQVVEEIVGSRPDAILSSGTPEVLALKRATKTIPIVFGLVADPVGSGVVASLARPGGNITGSFVSRRELQVKRLELLKEALPGVTRMAVFLAEGSSANQEWLKALERTARELGVALHPVEVRGPDDVERALSAIAHGQAEALVVSDASRLGPHAERIGAFVVEHRLPTIGASRQPSYLMAYWVRVDLL